MFWLIGILLEDKILGCIVLFQNTVRTVDCNHYRGAAKDRDKLHNDVNTSAGVSDNAAVTETEKVWTVDPDTSRDCCTGVNNIPHLQVP